MNTAVEFANDSHGVVFAQEQESALSGSISSKSNATIETFVVLNFKAYPLLFSAYGAGPGCAEIIFECGLRTLKQLFEILRSETTNFYALDASEFSDHARRLHNVGRFVTPSAIRHRREERAVCFD
jgi:hypothetical protein